MVAAASRKRAHRPVLRSISRLRSSWPSLGLEHFCLRARDNGSFMGDGSNFQGFLAARKHNFLWNTKPPSRENTCSIHSRDRFVTQMGRLRARHTGHTNFQSSIGCSYWSSPPRLVMCGILMVALRAYDDDDPTKVLKTGSWIGKLGATDIKYGWMESSTCACQTSTSTELCSRTRQTEAQQESRLPSVDRER